MNTVKKLSWPQVILQTPVTSSSNTFAESGLGRKNAAAAAAAATTGSKHFSVRRWVIQYPRMPLTKVWQVPLTGAYVPKGSTEQPALTSFSLLEQQV